MPQPTAQVETKKHRACDECRTRKLACSKDPRGCERCSRENITCHYSEQKPMGRPRKRQFIEVTKEDSIIPPNGEVSDPGMLSLDPQNYSDITMAEPYYTDGQQSFGNPQEHSTSNLSSKQDADKVHWHFGTSEIMSAPPIDFGDGELENLFSNQDSSQVQFPGSSTASTVSGSVNSPPQLGPCSCLPSMYLALSSLQELPTDIALALKTVRDAAATAAESIWCPKCGSVVLDDPNPPIDSFQNTMLLGTILPILANAYQKVLTKIDDETNEAIVTGQMKIFRFKDYGGMCGRQQTSIEAMTCVEKELAFNEVEMQPLNWRTTVRAMLRVDIYGHEQGGYKHKGLKDLVTEMELRQRMRHELLDAHVAAGGTTPGHFGQTDCHPGSGGEKMYNCLQILQMAKISIDNLVIA